jgi:transcriptional regulator with XRE-family HTH domain
MKVTDTKTRLEQIMAERNLRQIDIINLCEPFAKKYNVRFGRSDLSQYLSGKYLPKQKKLTILAKALNVNEAWLMGYDVPQSETVAQRQSTEKEIVTLVQSMSEDEKQMLLKIIRGMKS